MRAARGSPPSSLLQSVAAAYRKSLVAVEALLRDSDDDAEAREMAERRAKLPPFAQRSAAQKVLGEAYDLETARQEARTRLAIIAGGAAGGAVGGAGGGGAAGGTTEAEETAASTRLETLEVKMTRIVAALERLGSRPAGPAVFGAVGGRGEERSQASRAAGGGGPPFVFGSTAKRASWVSAFVDTAAEAPPQVGSLAYGQRSLSGR